MIKAITSLFSSSRPVVPVIPLNGLIAASSGAGLRRSGLNLIGLSKLLDKAFTTKRAAAVALLINSPGGSPVQSAIIASRIRELARKNDVPVISFVEDVAASGGYWLACAGDQIIANPASIIGSIGVVSAGFGFDRAIDKIGVDRRVYTSGISKSMLDPFRPENPDDVTHLKALQEDIHAQFIAMVKSRRGSRLNAADEMLFSGAFWTGQKSLELGLVDRLGDIRPVLQEQFGAKVMIRLMTLKKSLFGMGGGQMGITAGDQMVDVAIYKLEERLERMRYGL
jgi:serine protease SohB